MEATTQPDYEEVEQTELSFQGVEIVNGTALRVSNPWPDEQLPPNTASLLSISSKKELVAAAGPDTLSISSTLKTRRRYIPRPEDEAKPVRPFEPDVTISIPRVTHVTFSSDGNWLVIAAQEGGGLAVYETDKLSNSAHPAFQIATNGTSVRHILPNPNEAPDYSNYFGVVLTNGQLLLADFKSRQLVNTAAGSPIFAENVSTAAWSKLGKQVVVGLTDSTAKQIDPAGNVKAQIPRPPQLAELEGDYEGVQAFPVTAISWLSTNEFYFVYSPSYGDPGEGPNNDSLYFIVERAKDQPTKFRRFQIDPCLPFGLTSRTPAHQFISRLSDWHRAKDIMIVTSTASIEVGLFTRFAEAEHELPGGTFVTAAIDDETRRAQLPLTKSENESSPIGMGLDLSAREVAPIPMPKEDDMFPHSQIPLPVLYILNNDGLLKMWWVVYNDAVRQKVFYPGIVHRSGRYAMYRKLASVPKDGEEQTNDGANETEPLEGQSPVDAKPFSLPKGGAAPQANAAAPSGSNILSSRPSSTSPAPAQPQQSAFGQSSFGKPASQSQQTGFGQSAFGGSSTLGQKGSPWGAQAGSTPAKPGFGQSPFGAPSTPGQTSMFGKPSQPATGSAFGQPSQPSSGSAFGQSSQPTSGSAFGKPSQPAGSGFGQLGQMGANKPSAFGAPSTPGSGTFGQASGLGAASPFSQLGKADASKPSPFSSFAAKGDQPSASGFASLGLGGKPSPFAAHKHAPGLSQETSTGSTATLGSESSGLGSFGKPSGSFSSPFVSRESTQNENSSKQQGSGMFGLGAGGFKLGSGFKGDGTAKDDLPKPENPGAGLFGSDFGASLKGTQDIKKEPGTEKQGALKDIPAKEDENVAPEEAPLPPDPATYKAPPMPDDLPPMPGLGAAKKNDKDVPIAGSPPLDVTNSQTFSPAASQDDELSEEEDSDAEGEEYEEDGDEDGEEDEESEEGDEEDEQDYDDDDDDDEEATYVVQDQARLDAFKARIGGIAPASPERPARTESRTPQSDEKTEKSSYTPAGLPKGPVFNPPPNRPQQSPRSPSPQRAVTSPVRGPGIPQTTLPSQIKSSAVPPAKPVERPAAPPKPREPTAGELEDEAIERVEALLATSIEPSKDSPTFYTHSDYTGAVEKPGLGGQIERVFRDVNSMIHVVGLNARSLSSFIQGQEVLRKQGTRTRDDLDDAEAWSLGDLPDLDKLLNGIEKQLEEGKLEDVRGKLEDMSEEHKEILKIKSKTTEMRKQIQSHTDPVQRAMADAAPLSAETQAQQSELRQGVQKVQRLLSEVEQKMSILRADLASISRDTASTNGNAQPVPTVEAVTNTILKMTSMVQQKSADIDLLEAQIKRLPQGIVSLRLEDDYEDDLAARFSTNLRNSPAATPPSRRPRMAANGDALGMSGMFGASRFSTPPSMSGRRSRAFTPEASGLGRSTGSLSGSARKKMSEVTGEEVANYQRRVQRRGKVLGALKGRVEREGARVVKVD